MSSVRARISAKPFAWLEPAAILALLIAAAGCMQLETRVRVNEDGSATVIERLRFSRALLDQAGDRQAELLGLLSREAALERMKSMGEGVRLVKHVLREAGDDSRESVAVFQKDDINGLRYASPWPAFPDYASNNIVEFRMYPLYKSQPYQAGVAGHMCIEVRHLKPPKGEAPPPKDAPPPKGPSPLELQVFRDTGPMFRDMMKGFRIRLVVESYSAVHHGLGVRGEKAGANEVDLIFFTDRDLDKHGRAFLENEELMLDLVRWELGSQDIVNHVSGYGSNPTIPVFAPLGSRYMWWYGGHTIWFKPSRQLFDRHFAGKKLDYSHWQAQPPEKHVPAEFEKIGCRKPIPPKEDTGGGGGDGK
ncbi:MAG: hypothetical protein N3A38_11860 [Planctomycetota bacterium]|nr:hypothetical protein [Planctomycetota bacterium]